MKIKFLTIFLTGLLLGTLLGNILFGQVIAQDYQRTDIYYLKRILNGIENIESYVSYIPDIEEVVSDIKLNVTGY